MKVSLIKNTEEAKELLIFTKRTRRLTGAGALEEVRKMTEEEKDKELNYVFSTIGSSWEFVDYIFLIEGVTRAFTHQLVRHRVGTAFAQQAQRIAQMSDFAYLASGDTEGSYEYHDTMKTIQKSYDSMLSKGIPTQDARGILPTNILTNILFKANLRTLSGIMEVRLCVRAQGEFQRVALAMREEVVRVHPWAKQVLQPYCVATGRCKFPRYATECPVPKKCPWIIMPEKERQETEDVWQSLQSKFEPQPE